MAQRAPTLKRLARAVGELKVGDGLDGEVSQGLLINETAARKVEEHVADAVARGARVVAGGRRHALGGICYEPTLLSVLAPAMRLAPE